MRKAIWFPMVGSLVCGLLCGMVHDEVQAAKQLTPKKVVEKADSVAMAKSSHMIMTQTIQTTSGDKRTFTIESWTENGSEKSLMRFLSPAPSRGIGMLALDNGDNIWAYFPDSDDLRKIASSARNQSMQGSDFSYEDMTAGEYGKRYKAVSMSGDKLNGKACWKVILKPSESSPYAKIELWIDKQTYIAYQAYHYDQEDKHIKTLKLKNWKQIKGVWTPYVMVMHNHERDSKTTIKIKKLKYNAKLKDDLFTTRTLTMM